MELSKREKEENIKPDPEIDIYLKAAATGEQKAEVVTNHILKILGLDICADTLVGNNMLRGISGGQKKRVTTGKYSLRVRNIPDATSYGIKLLFNPTHPFPDKFCS
jgi:hypothetical protein